MARHNNDYSGLPAIFWAAARRHRPTLRLRPASPCRCPSPLAGARAPASRPRAGYALPRLAAEVPPYGGARARVPRPRARGAGPAVAVAPSPCPPKPPIPLFAHVPVLFARALRAGNIAFFTYRFVGLWGLPSALRAPHNPMYFY